MRIDRFALESVSAALPWRGTGGGSVHLRRLEGEGDTSGLSVTAAEATTSRGSVSVRDIWSPAPPLGPRGLCERPPGRLRQPCCCCRWTETSASFLAVYVNIQINRSVSDPPTHTPILRHTHTHTHTHTPLSIFVAFKLRCSFIANRS